MFVKYGEQIQLPLVRKLTESLRGSGCIVDPESIMVISYQHYLKTFVDLMLAIADLGVPVNQMYACGKNYSYNERVHRRLLELGIRSFGCNKVVIPGTFRANMIGLAKNMLEEASRQCREQHLKKVVIISDGFCAIEEAVKCDWGDAKLSGVLQTGSAHYVVDRLTKPIPLVDIAYSAAKVQLEAPFIADTGLSVVQKVVEDVPNIRSIGIVGIGNIGTRVLPKVKELFPLLSVNCCDSRADAEVGDNGMNLERLLQCSDLIIGCCGRDVFIDRSELVQNILRGRFGSKVFASFSSGDYEFLTLLRFGSDIGGWQRVNDGLQQSDLLYSTADGEHQICVLSGGYPVNFNNTGISLSDNIVQLTRALLLSAFAQALNRPAFNKDEKVELEEIVHVLDAQAQHELAVDYLSMVDQDYRLYSKDMHNNFNDTEWIAKHSQYRYCKTKDQPDT